MKIKKTYCVYGHRQHTICLFCSIKVFIERILVILKMAYCLQVLCSVLKARSQRYKLRQRLKLIQEVLVLRLKHRHQKYVSLPTLRHAVTEKSGTRF